MQYLEAIGQLPLRAVIEDQYLDQVGINGRWFVTRVHPKRVEGAARRWKLENPRRKHMVPEPIELARDLFEAFCWEARKDGRLGGFVWCDRLDMGFVEVPTESCQQGSFKEPLMNVVIDRPVAFIMDEALTTLCRKHQVWIERELEVRREDVTKALFGEEYRNFETLEKIAGVA